jgi:hypothetical protein
MLVVGGSQPPFTVLRQTAMIDLTAMASVLSLQHT